jgi:uncharacterized protein (TIGR03086 family)
LQAGHRLDVLYQELAVHSPSVTWYNEEGVAGRRRDVMDIIDPVRDVYPAAVASFERVLRRVRDADLDRPTPCSDWDVEALVGHLVDEHRWVAPLLAGRRIPDIAPELDDDVLGGAPWEAWQRHSTQSLAAVAALDDVETVVHLSYGEAEAQEYLAQLVTDHLIHAWDLAQAIGGDQHLDAGLVGWVGHWFASVEGDYRAAGLIGDRPPIPEAASARTWLLAMAGRVDDPTAAAVTRFDEAFGHQDLDAVMAKMTDDCVFESTAPPDGVRYEGAAAVRGAFEEFFTASPPCAFTAEELVTAGSRAVLRWRYTWDREQDEHVRGIDLYTVRDGLIAEKLSYVKG